VGMFNPFVDNYKQESENRSQYASYKKSNYINESSHMLLVRFAWNFSFGRTFKADQKRLNNSDDDSGVMSTGK
ncbi:TonB-dependent receptor SusC, partial [termite gut metagenome]